MAKLKDQALKLLKLDEKPEHAKYMTMRLKALSLASECWKCNGSGKILAFSHIVSGRCFACGGLGVSEPRITKELLSRLEDKIQAGELETYLEKKRNEALAKKQAKPVLAEIDKAWKSGAIHDDYKKCSLWGRKSSEALFIRVGILNALWKSSQDILDSELTINQKLDKLGEYLRTIQFMNQFHLDNSIPIFQNQELKS